jgi:hypothetical protein
VGRTFLFRKFQEEGRSRESFLNIGEGKVHLERKFQGKRAEGRTFLFREKKEVCQRQEETGKATRGRKTRQAHPEQGEAGRIREPPTRAGRVRQSRSRQEEAGRVRETTLEHPGQEEISSVPFIFLEREKMPGTAWRGKRVLTFFPEFLQFLKT